MSCHVFLSGWNGWISIHHPESRYQILSLVTSVWLLSLWGWPWEGWSCSRFHFLLCSLLWQKVNSNVMWKYPQALSKFTMFLNIHLKHWTEIYLIHSKTRIWLQTVRVPFKALDPPSLRSAALIFLWPRPESVKMLPTLNSSINQLFEIAVNDLNTKQFCAGREGHFFQEFHGWVSRWRRQGQIGRGLIALPWDLGG